MLEDPGVTTLPSAIVTCRLSQVGYFKLETKPPHEELTGDGSSKSSLNPLSQEKKKCPR